MIETGAGVCGACQAPPFAVVATCWQPTRARVTLCAYGRTCVPRPPRLPTARPTAAAPRPNARPRPPAPPANVESKQQDSEALHARSTAHEMERREPIARTQVTRQEGFRAAHYAHVTKREIFTFYKWVNSAATVE
jgi:hypothetical protein